MVGGTTYWWGVKVKFSAGGGDTPPTTPHWGKPCNYAILSSLSYLDNARSAELLIRPIGVGKVVRRIVGKTIVWSLGSEIHTNPILRTLKTAIPSISQVWLADDATGAGKLHPLKEWWDLIKMEGTKYGYFVKPTKSWLILKDGSKLEE